MGKQQKAPAFAAALMAIALNAGAEVPRVLDYQGYLSSAAGAPVDQSVDIVFGLYRVAVGGSALWTETQTVAVDNGLFSVKLGNSTPLPEVIGDGALWLGLAVGGDLEMTPRREVTSAAFALRTQTADTLEGASLDDVLTYATLGGIPAGARVPVLAINASGISIDPASVAMAVDGRSFSVAYPPLSQPIWAPLTVEYTYPIDAPSPLDVTSGGTTGFANFEMLLADDGPFGFELLGTSITVVGVESTIVSEGSGSPMIVERVDLQGGFVVQAAAPPFAGPLAVTLSFGGSDTIDVGGRGPLIVDVPVAAPPGPGAQPRYLLDIEDFGPSEFQLLETSYAVPDQIVIDLRLSGTPVAGGGGCKLDSISGLAPATLDDGGTPVDSLRFEAARFDCDAAN